MHPSQIQFYTDAQANIEEMMSDNPIIATFLGDHRYDSLLGSFTLQAIADQRKRLGVWLEKFRAYDVTGWTLDAKIDCIILTQLTKQFIRQIDAQRMLQRYPGAGADETLSGIYALIMREFAPLQERLKSILSRLLATPRVLAESRALVIPAEVPLIWATIALEGAQQGVGLFTGLIPLADAAPEIKADLIVAVQNATVALQEHATWIEQSVLPLAKGNFATGKVLFDEILREDHMVDYDSDALLSTGWKLYEDTERQLTELAATMSPVQSAKELLEAAKLNHPTADGLLDAYRLWMDKARQFVLDNEIATIPASESIRIDPTPAFHRMTTPYAAYCMPGFFEKVQEGIFWVTPVDENASLEATESKLRGHSWADIPVTALHEAYPGHHLQLVVANTLSSTPRKLGAFLSSLFLEGWAFYCEELMEQLGFIDQPIQKLARLEAQAWRASRIIIDASLHTGKMTVDEAISFLVERAGLEPNDAKAEVRRYTLSPTQPQCYLMGKLQILDIVDEYKRRFPQTSLCQMHDAILLSGSLPPRLMRWKLFGEEMGK